jgi:arginase
METRVVKPASWPTMMSSRRAVRLPISIVWAPTALGLSPNPLSPSHPRGTWRAPAELRRAGLPSALGNPPEHELASVADYDARRSARTGQRNEAALATQTRELAELLGVIIADAHWPLVVGGDCSLLIGAGLAMRRRGRIGLVFVDGHLDFRHPGNSERLSAAAGEDLAAVTGRGLPSYTDVDGLAPYFRDEDVIALGERDGHPDAADIEQTAITVRDLETLRARGLASMVEEVLAHFNRREVERLWLHLDLDVLDSSEMPAVDSPQPDGLTFTELPRLIAPLATHPGCVGADVTIFDPELAPPGLSERLVGLIARCVSSQPDR